MDQLTYQAINKITQVLNENKDFLTELDRTIGDGDHGINMARGFNAAMKKLTLEEDITIETALKRVGMALISNVGGASGPLYGSLFLKISPIMHNKSTISKQDLLQMLETGLDAVKDRGKAVAGDKTMIDALEPAYKAYQNAYENNMPVEKCILDAYNAAKDGVEYTKTIVAKKGRASYLGERSIGHQDPGATSITLILVSILEVVKTYKDTMEA